MWWHKLSLFYSCYKVKYNLEYFLHNPIFSLWYFRILSVYVWKPLRHLCFVPCQFLAVRKPVNEIENPPIPPKNSVIWKKHYKNQINAKSFKKCLIFLLISIKNDHKIEKIALKIMKPELKNESSNFWKKSGHPWHNDVTNGYDFGSNISPKDDQRPWFHPLQQACQTQNTARAAKGVFMPKKLFAGRS